MPANDLGQCFVSLWSFDANRWMTGGPEACKNPIPQIPRGSF